MYDLEPPPVLCPLLASFVPSKARYLASSFRAKTCFTRRSSSSLARLVLCHFRAYTVLLPLRSASRCSICRGVDVLAFGWCEEYSIRCGKPNPRAVPTLSTWPAMAVITASYSPKQQARVSGAGLHVRRQASQWWLAPVVRTRNLAGTTKGKVSFVKRYDCPVGHELVKLGSRYGS
jgi:hypothetical protein